VAGTWVPPGTALGALRAIACSRNSCWETETFTDAGTTVQLGAGWSCFMADRHFSDAHRCGDRRGGFCDGIAAHAQSPRRVRLVEAKATPDFTGCISQLRRGGEFALSAPAIQPADLLGECHARSAPRTTVRPSARYFEVRGYRVPLHLFVDGQRVL
jgi:hypothetical protein